MARGLRSKGQRQLRHVRGSRQEEILGVTLLCKGDLMTVHGSRHRGDICRCGIRPCVENIRPLSTIVDLVVFRRNFRAASRHKVVAHIRSQTSHCKGRLRSSSHGLSAAVVLVAPKYLVVPRAGSRRPRQRHGILRSLRTLQIRYIIRHDVIGQRLFSVVVTTACALDFRLTDVLAVRPFHIEIRDPVVDEVVIVALCQHKVPVLGKAAGANSSLTIIVSGHRCKVARIVGAAELEHYLFPGDVNALRFADLADIVVIPDMTNRHLES